MTFDALALGIETTLLALRHRPGDSLNGADADSMHLGRLEHACAARRAGPQASASDSPASTGVEALIWTQASG